MDGRMERWSTILGAPQPSIFPPFHSSLSTQATKDGFGKFGVPSPVVLNGMNATGGGRFDVRCQIVNEYRPRGSYPELFRGHFKYFCVRFRAFCPERIDPVSEILEDVKTLLQVGKMQLRGIRKQIERQRVL